MALDMNPEIRARWAAALRSGDYEQGHEALRQISPDGGPDKWCCLGVLCDLAERGGTGTVTRLSPGDGADMGLWYYDGRADYLPEAVREWAGLAESNPYVPDPVLDRNDAPLAVLNDERKRTFAQIADAIDGGQEVPRG